MTNKPYSELAETIIASRSARRLTQGELASELDVKQQSVSRWEAGTHRPAVDQIPRLASLIDVERETLMRLAGYGTAVVASQTALFPVDALDPDTFEYFVADLVAELHPEADVRVQGSRGHDQRGTDVTARFPDGRIWSFQCKRVERFGKAEVDKVVEKHLLPAERKFLVLSRIASPAAAEAITAHAGWTIWDKQDISRLVRKLPEASQDRLVSIYFRGERLSLLGRSEPGPWLTSEQFFVPFKVRTGAFSHEWQIVGRRQEVSDLLEALAADAPAPFVLLVGPGGIGKTRVLKDAIDVFRGSNPNTRVHFLSAWTDPDAANLAALGSGRKLVVVDDAHDRESLGAVFEYVANPLNKARLLLATRPYAEQRLRSELTLAGATSPPTIRLGPLDKPALRALVVEVLTEFGGEPHWADRILEAAGESPLVAAMAARVVARDGQAVELAARDSDFTSVILARFTNVIAGQLGSPGDAPFLRSLLEILALIQPFHIDDRRIAELIERVRGSVDTAAVSRGLKVLAEGGVIYKRGSLWRLMPDLLGDFLIEQACVGADGTLTPFAAAIAAHVGASQLTQVLVNLGRLDWRRAGGDPSKSALLQPVWAQLNAISDKYDPRVSAVEAAAYYQPGQALAFVQAQIERGNDLPEIPKILKRVAYAAEHRGEALRLLWDLGRDDRRQLNSNLNHPIRALKDLIEFDEFKPLDFIEEIAEFAFSLVDDADAWTGAYSPFDVLEPLLAGEVTSTSWSHRAVSLTSLFVDYDRVAPLRRRMIDLILTLLGHGDASIARRAAHTLNSALRAPHGMMGAAPPDDLAEKIDAEIAATIARVAALAASGKLAWTTLIALVDTLDWHASYGPPETQTPARQMFAALPTSREFRLLASMTDKAEWRFIGQVPFDDWEEDKAWLASLVDDLLTDRDTAELLDLIEEDLTKLRDAGEPSGGARAVLAALAKRRPDAADEIIHRARRAPDTLITFFLGVGVADVIEHRAAEGRALVRELLASPEPLLRTGGVRGLFGLRRDPDAQDLALLAEVISTDDLEVGALGLDILRHWRDVPKRQVAELALGARIDRHPELVERLAGLFSQRKAKLLDQLTPSEVGDLLGQFVSVPRLSGHWAGELIKGLAVRHGQLVADFLLARLKSVLDDTAPDDFRVLDFSHRRDNVGLEEASDAKSILRRLWDWLRQLDGRRGLDTWHVAETFATMFRIDSAIVIEFFETLLETAATADITWIGRILRHSHHSFAFERQTFVMRLLERCKTLDRALLEEVRTEIRIAAITGSWSGTVGEPTPRDLKAQANAKAALANLSRLSPAYPLYRGILDHAEEHIAQTLRENQELDDVD